MRVLVTANTSWNIFNFRKKLIVELLKSHDVFLVAKLDKTTSNLRKLGCKFIDLDIKQRSTNLIGEIKLFINFLKTLIRIKPHVVLSFTIKPNIYSSLACRFLNIKNICNITGLGYGFIGKYFIRILLIILIRISIKKSSYIFFQNNDDLRFFKRNKLVENNFKILPGSGIDFKKFKQKKVIKKKSKIYKFLYVGRIIKDKGIFELVEAFRKLTNDKKILKNVKLFLVGSLKDDLTKIILKKKIKNLYIKKFTRNVSKYYVKSDCFVFPSYREGMSRSLLEAGIYKLPIICSNVSGNNQLIKHNHSGYLFRDKSSKSLLSSMKKIIMTDKRKLLNFTNNLYKNIKEKYNDDIVLNEYLCALKKFKL